MKDCKFFDRYDYDLYKEYVSFQLKKVLEKKEITVSQLATVSNLGLSSIYRYLRGSHLPTLRAGCNLAYALGVSPTYLFCPNDFAEFGFCYPKESYKEELSVWPRVLAPVKYNWLKNSAKNLTWLAQHYGLSKRAVSMHTGIPQPAVSRYFSASREPSLENALELLWLFDGRFEDIWYYGVLIGE